MLTEKFKEVLRKMSYSKEPIQDDEAPWFKEIDGKYQLAGDQEYLFLAWTRLACVYDKDEIEFARGVWFNCLRFNQANGMKICPG